jgi:substrate import-associated zinc metallohydrolase lipoprotein
MAVALASCRKETLSPESVITVDAQTKNDFDKWLDANYVHPYNIQVKYRYEMNESDFSYYTIAPSLEYSIMMAHIVKYVCIETYDEVAGVDFTRRYFPKMFFYTGEWEYKNNGTFILGTAEGGRKIFLAGLNYLPRYVTSAANLNHYYLKTIHHEFTHILNQVKDYPTSFRQVTPNSYVNDSQFEEPYVSNYLARGFISAYAQTEDREDFAEMVSEYVTHTAEWWEQQLQAADKTWEGDINQTQTGRSLIEQKLDITRAYMHDTWNIDLDELRDCILRRQDNVAAGLVNLTDLTVD